MKRFLKFSWLNDKYRLNLQDISIETQNSVDGVFTTREETYLCTSSVKYVKPVRAINSKGEWRIVLNHLKAKDDFISQSVRVELCDHPGEKCPKVPGTILEIGCLWQQPMLRATMPRKNINLLYSIRMY